MLHSVTGYTQYSNLGHYWNLYPGTALTSGADILTLSDGTYYAPSNEIASSFVNKPSGLGLNCKIIVEQRVPQRKCITIFTGVDRWINQQISASEWSGWQKQPSRTEITALNNSLALESAILTAYDDRVEQGSTIDVDLSRCYRSGHVRALSVFVSVKKELTSAQTSLLVLPSGYIPSKNVYGLIFDVSKNRTFVCQVASSGNFNVYHDGLLSVGDRLYANMVFMM